MEKKVHAVVADMLNDESVMNLPMATLVDMVILPRIMGLPGFDGGCRYRITDRYMQLITEHAQDIINGDYNRGVVCLKLALQRFARSTVYPNVPIDYDDLPSAYKHLSAKYDEVGTPSKECWRFMRDQIELCLSLPQTEDIAKSLLLQLVANLQPVGRCDYDVYLSNCDFDVDAKQARDWAYDILYHTYGWKVIYDYFATPELYHKVPDLWLQDWHNIDKKDLIRRLEIKGLFKERKLKKMLGIK